MKHALLVFYLVLVSALCLRSPYMELFCRLFLPILGP